MNQSTNLNKQSLKQSAPLSDSSSASLSRRNFLLAATTGSISLMTFKLPLMAGPFENADFEKLVPPDKKLDPNWVKSLFERGEPTVYRGSDLKYIGMPVGGICAGQLYLGGDGKLWNWDIFNRKFGTGDGNYKNPPEPSYPVEQGFILKIADKSYPLDKAGFPGVTFRGEYPVGVVNYRREDVPVEIKLEAFSPFIPLNADDSGLPVAVMRFTLKNMSDAVVEGSLIGTLENAVCLRHRETFGTRVNEVISRNGFTFINCSAKQPAESLKSLRPDVVFEDWSKPTYEGWHVEGTAFGSGPIAKSSIPTYQGDVGGDSSSVVNSHATAPGPGVGEKDAAMGKLTSSTFKIEREFIRFWIGGGNHPRKTCLNLVVNGKVERSCTGRDDNQMSQQSFSVRDLKDKEAFIEIIDAETGAWGNVGVGKIVFTDQPLLESRFELLEDFGTMGLALLGTAPEIKSGDVCVALSEKLSGELGRHFRLEAHQNCTVTFLITWHFPNLQHISRVPTQGRYYAAKFESALQVAAHVASNIDRLTNETLLWRDTWYDSTLPYWFLDRTMLNTSILATSTCYRFKDGRFWAFEGVGCCEGTCGHVWHYAQAMGRLFPELERSLRERVDFGLAMQPSGAIYFRGENNDFPAIDAQAGAVLRTLREYQMSADDGFLKRVWPGVKKATQWLMAQDGNGDGFIEGPQHNTLDTDWYGPVAWLSGLYLAALQAAAVMADEMGDAAFSRSCRNIFLAGQKKMVTDLFDGEYFRNKPSPDHADSVNSGSGCEIDQVMGQSWAFQVGLQRVFPEKETRQALKSLWKYNFTPDAGHYREVNKPGRWYAMSGEAGLLMCTFPRSDWNYDKAKGFGKGLWAAMYFNECMNGFEHQVAGHMVWEDMVLEGLAIERSIHDRYHASKRNPWNEVECGDHYSRSMASYGVFLAACGFEYHGPKGHIGFAPRLSPDRFKCAFTSAEGWGSYSQELESKKFKARLELKYGKLHLTRISIHSSEEGRITVAQGKHHHRVKVERNGDRIILELHEPVSMVAGETLEILIG